LAGVLLASAALCAALASSATAEVIYRNIPSKHAGLPALGFECCEVAEFGGEVAFAGSKRTSPTVIVDLASYACEEGGSGAECKTKPNATFEWPLTLNIYQVGAGDEVGPEILQVTKTFKIPYRPSQTPKCPLEEGAFKGYGKECVISKMHEVSFRLPGVKLPNEAIIAVAFNTETYGKEPTGMEGPENSLNVAINANYACTKENPTTKECEEFKNVSTEPPEVGSDPIPTRAFADSGYEGVMCGGPLNMFAATGECWSFEQPAFEVEAEKK
jgi:hypothetical protein